MVAQYVFTHYHRNHLLAFIQFLCIFLFLYHLHFLTLSLCQGHFQLPFRDFRTLNGLSVHCFSVTNLIGFFLNPHKSTFTASCSTEFAFSYVVWDNFILLFKFTTYHFYIYNKKQHTAVPIHHQHAAPDSYTPALYPHLSCFNKFGTLYFSSVKSFAQ